MLAIAVKAAQVFFEDADPDPCHWWELTVLATTLDGFVVTGQRSTFFFARLERQPA